MNPGLKMVIGMTLAYVTSFAGLLLAWRAWRRHQEKREESDE